MTVGGGGGHTITHTHARAHMHHNHWSIKARALIFPTQSSKCSHPMRSIDTIIAVLVSELVDILKHVQQTHLRIVQDEIAALAADVSCEICSLIR